MKKSYFGAVLLLILVSLFLISCGTNNSPSNTNSDNNLPISTEEKVSLIEPSSVTTENTNLDRTQIVNLVNETFNLDQQNSQYLKAKVKKIHDPNNQKVTKHLVVYLLNKKNYLFETRKLDLDTNYRVQKITNNYQETETELLQSEEKLKADPSDDEIEAFFATCNTEFQSAVDGVEKAAELAQKAGYKVKTLIGKEATVSAYKYWMQKPNIKIFGNIGHGSTSGIMLADGTLSSSWFKTLSKDALNNKVLYFNSCQVHNDPLESSILGAGVQKFIGGNINLLVGSSEKVFVEFWNLTINNRKEMTPSVAQAEKNTNYPDKNAHGISGNGSENVNSPGNVTPNPSTKPSPNPSTNPSPVPSTNPSPKPSTKPSPVPSNRPTPNATNIALNKAANASSSYSNEYLPKQAFDGDSNTRWAARTAYNNQWVTVDLAKNYNISSMRIKWSLTNYPRKYTIYSWDGSKWISIKTVSSDGNMDEIKFDTPFSGRTISINCTNPNSSNYVMYECEIYE